MVLPHDEVVPFIKYDLCPGSQACGLCRDVCPSEAIEINDGQITVDATLCKGCGACVAICPHRAIHHPTLSPEQLDRELKKILPAKEAPSGIIAFTCRQCAVPEDRAEEPAYSGDVTRREVPCLAAVSPWLILRALERGAPGVALVHSNNGCPTGFSPELWQENTRFVQALGKVWGIEPERCRVIAGDDPRDLARQLSRFAQEIKHLKPTPLSAYEPAPIPSRSLLLPTLIKDWRDKLGKPVKSTVTAGAVPFGRLELDTSRCSACSLCASACPTGALTAAADKKERIYQLLFQHELCLGCSRCLKACPEQCLKLEKILELDRLGKPPVVLFEDKMARCRECGHTISPQATINKLQKKLADYSPTSHLELCPRCKANLFTRGKTGSGDNGHIL